MILCVPTLSVEMERVATPFALRVGVPRVVAPSRKVTVPAGTAIVFEVTVAVKIIP